MSLVIASAMKERKVTQVELGKNLGIADRTVRKWISGKCRADQYLGLCAELGLSIKVTGGLGQVMEIKGDFIVTHKTGKV